MKKIVAFVVILVMAISLSAQFKTGMDFRTRAEMYNMNYDVAVWQRITDLRFRPWMTYTQNDYLMAKWEIEIGDIGFGVNTDSKGNDVGGDIGTDGVNVETKSLFLQIAPNKENAVIVGLQPYKDFHGLLLDWDVAGISWTSKRALAGKDFSSTLAWFVSADGNEKSVDESTYSLGSTEIVADFDYKLNDKMKFGMNNIFQFVRSEINADVHETSFNMWIAPYFAGTFDKFYAEAVFGMNNISPDYETFNDVEYSPYNPKHSGLVFSLKTKYNVNDDVDARFNFLYRGGDELGMYDPEGGFDHYYGIHSYYSTGLEILTESGCGLDGKGQVFSPITTYGNVFSGYAAGHAGIILPAVFVDYKVKNIKEKMPFMNSMKLTLGLGYAVTAVEIERVTGDDGVARPESAIGTELNLKAEMQMFDALYVKPYFAMLFPGEWYNYENDHDHAFTKVGLSLITKLK